MLRKEVARRYSVWGKVTSSVRRFCATGMGGQVEASTNQIETLSNSEDFAQ